MTAVATRGFEEGAALRDHVRVDVPRRSSGRPHGPDECVDVVPFLAGSDVAVLATRAASAGATVDQSGKRTVQAVAAEAARLCVLCGRDIRFTSVENPVVLRPRKGTP